MDRIDKKNMRLFEQGSAGKHVEIYRGIVELCARFGYVSIREVMYGFELPIRKAINRLTYLTRCGMVRKFDSFTVPKQFYCLTPAGREAVERFGVSDEVREFQPSRDYKLIYQHHERLLVKCFIALRKIFGSNFLGWVSEAQLKKEYAGKGARVVDGEFFLKGSPSKKCGVELELSLKSPARYRKQFKSLSEQVFDSWSKVQRIDLLLFIYESAGIRERLISQINSNNFGDCRIFLVQKDEFFMKLRGAIFEEIVSGKIREISAGAL